MTPPTLLNYETNYLLRLYMSPLHPSISVFKRDSRGYLSSNLCCLSFLLVGTLVAFLLLVQPCISCKIVIGIIELFRESRINFNTIFKEKS